MKITDEGKRLYRLGFAIHWLKANSKVPVEAGWTKGSRASWDYLKASYRPGLNIGVRLGRASQFRDGTYLAVIDCDVKSNDKRHLKEMKRKLRTFVDADGCSRVLSGRGNGSQHLYVRTKRPAAPTRLSQSSEKVRVSMPSVEPSRYEKKTLTAADLKQGIRLRAAWEISLMGEGQQVVLPPSVHPDTGATYSWGSPIETSDDLPLVKLSRFTASEKAEPQDTKPSAPFVAEEVDLVSSILPDRIVDMILSGEGVEDRSAALFGAAIAMLKSGFSDNQVLSVLTDRETYLGEAAYEHAKTNNRKRAAEWITRYTLSRAKEESSISKHFKEAVIEEPLSDEAAEKQIRGLLHSGDWKAKIERNGGQEDAAPKPTVKNVCLILVNSTASDVFKRNAFTMTDHYTVDTPWGGTAGHEVRDIDLVRIKFWLSVNYRFEPSSNLILDAVLKISDGNRYHPVRDFVRSLEWDGKPRLDDWLSTYLGATGPEGYLRAVSRKTLVAMVARVMNPGCKFDHVLILEGLQGVGKSTAVRILADPWFSDAPINIGDKDAVMSMQHAWIMELGELSSMRKADIDLLKQFISQSTDRIRLPYGKLVEAFPRQCIFIGTTNSYEYLKDTTGNRRFWPVKVRQCDFEALKRDRDQLLAEALFAYELGEPLYLENEKDEAAATEQQKGRVFVDSWVDELKRFMSKKQDNFNTETFMTSDLFSEYGPFRQWKATKAEQMRAAEALRSVGFIKRNRRVDGVKGYFWEKS